LEAVGNVYAQEEREHPVYISSSKTIFGHCQASAAFVGVLKVILSMRYRVIPPHHTDFYPQYKSGPLQIPGDFVPVDESRKYIGTVSSFGFSKC
jgi:acyl transferase domain-containing protein